MASVAILSESRTVSTVCTLSAQVGGSGELKQSLIIVTDETNQPVQPGPHAADFGERVDRTQFLGLTVPPGASWQAKSAFSRRRAVFTRHHQTEVACTPQMPS